MDCPYLSGPKMRAVALLYDALTILDEIGEGEAAIYACTAIEKLTGAPSTLEQWHAMMGRNAE